MTDDTMRGIPDPVTALGLTGTRGAKRRVEIDTAKYQAYLDDPSLTDAQRAEIVEALWMIIVAFVDMGFGVHPIQEVCGQLDQALDERGEEDSNESKPKCETFKGEFNDKYPND